MEEKYTTSLETMKHDVGSILNEKLKATSSEAVADYVSFALDNLDANIERAKQAKKDLDAYIKVQTSNIEAIKEGTAKWLSDSGIDKLEGMRISSLTTYVPVAEKKLIIHDKDCEFLKDKEFIKTSLDKSAVIKFLENTDVDYSEFVELEIINKQPLIKTNKRKV